MRCERCHQHREAGAEYRFYYGHRLSAQAVRFPPSDRRSLLFIDGHKDVWICHVCLAQRLFFSTMGVILLLLVAAVSLAGLSWLRPDLSWSLLGEHDLIVASIAAVLLALLLLLLQAITFGTEWLRIYGDELALALYRDELGAQGYNRFATRWLFEQRRALQ